MEPNAFHREFHHACSVGDMTKIHEAIATGRLTVEDLGAELKQATLMSHADAVATHFLTPVLAPQRGQRAVSTEKDFHQDPRIVRLFLDNGLDPKARISSGEPLLSYVASE